jgi:hypothetical protein
MECRRASDENLTDGTTPEVRSGWEVAIGYRRLQANTPLRFGVRRLALSIDTNSTAQLKPNVLRAGDAVRLVSPASTPDESNVEQIATLLESNGLRVQLGRHVFDRFGYLAGRDEDRLNDLNEAINDTWFGQSSRLVAERVLIESQMALTSAPYAQTRSL